VCSRINKDHTGENYVATHREVAHRWAQDDSSVRPVRGFNMFYDARVGDGPSPIFSHGRHYAAACHLTDAHGRRVTLINVDGYSHSTRQPLSRIRRALPSHRTIFEVDRVGAGFETANFEGMCARALKLYERAQKRRNSFYASHDIHQAGEIL